MNDINYKGLVGLYRTNGQKRMYMSNLINQNWITLRVYEAKDYVDFGEKRVSAKSGKPLLELELSSSQFAELLTTMNVGNGVPCTLKSYGGTRMDHTSLEEEEKSMDVGLKYFKENSKEMTEKIIRTIEKCHLKMESIKISKKDKETVTSLLYTIETEIASNLPFYVTIFEETAKKIATETKGEIDSFLASEIVKAGIKSLGLGDKLCIKE